MTLNLDKTIGDLAVSASVIFAAVSQIAEAATPILTFLTSIATLIWWIFRYAERISGKSNNLGDD